MVGSYFRPGIVLVRPGIAVELQQVSGWGVYRLVVQGAYCQASVGFLLLPAAPSVSCPCLDALHTRSSKLPPSPSVSFRLLPSPNV